MDFASSMIWVGDCKTNFEGSCGVQNPCTGDAMSDFSSCFLGLATQDKLRVGLKSMHRDAMSDFSSSLLGLSAARQTLRPYAPQSSCLESKGGDVDPLPDVPTCCQIERWICSLIQCTPVDFV